MIIYRQGDIFQSEAQALVNPVNCQGVMGKGLALQFKKRYPNTERDYRRLCRLGQMQTGLTRFHPPEHGKIIISFPTKQHWRHPSRPEWIAAGLQDLLAKAKAAGLTSIALPSLGAGLGGLPWPQVKAIIQRELNNTAIRFEVYEPRP